MVDSQILHYKILDKLGKNGLVRLYWLGQAETGRVLNINLEMPNDR